MKELEELKEEFGKGSREKDKTIEELNQRMMIREEQIEQFRSKLSTANAEKMSVEIEVDGLSNEIQHLKVVMGIEVDKIQRECAQEQTKNIELHSQIGVLEEQVAEYTSINKKQEGIVFNSQNELGARTNDIKSIQKVVVALNAGESKTSPRSVSKQAFHVGVAKEEGNDLSKTPPLVKGGEGESSSYYSMKINQRKSSTQVHNESHTLSTVVSLREQLQAVRFPLEHFTKFMLERLLAHTSRYGNNSPLFLSSSSDPMGGSGANRKSTLDSEAAINKWKSKLMHKTEELDNLRSIMKARARTAEVAMSSLRSKLESQARAFQTENAKLKYQIKILKQERDEHLSLRTMYAKRCKDYIDEITTLKRVMDKRKQEYDELMVLLQKTIQRKLELSTEVEEYKMELERNTLIPI